MKSLLKEKKRLNPRIAIISASICSLVFLVYSLVISSSIPQQFLVAAQSKMFVEPLNVKGSGVITTETIDFVSAPYSGVIDAVTVKEGQFVTQSQPLIKIKNHELELELVESKFSRDDLAADARLQISQLKQTRLSKESELKRLEAIRALKLTEMEAIRELEKQGIVSKLDSRKAELELSLAKLELDSKVEEFQLFSESYLSQIESLNDRVKTKSNKLNFLTNLIASLEMESDLSGVVKQVAVKKGQVVSHGQKLFELINPNNMMAKISIPQYSSSSVKEGQRATVITPNGSLQGRVEYVDNVVRSGAINISLAFDGATPAWLRLEQSVEAIIETDQTINKAVVKKPTEYAQYKEWVAYRVVNNDQATKVNYSLLDRGDGFLDVIGQSAELDTLILVPKQFSTVETVEL